MSSKTRRGKELIVTRKAYDPEHLSINYGLRYEVDQSLQSFEKAEYQRKEELHDFVQNVELKTSDLNWKGRQVPHIYKTFTADLLREGFEFQSGSYKGWDIGVLDGGFSDLWKEKGKKLQGNYELWKDLLDTTMYNLLPVENFSLYIVGNGKEGRPLPVYYMEFFMRDNPRSRRDAEIFIVWEMDQGMMERPENNSALNRGLRMSSYAHAYTKVYFYKNDYNRGESLQIDRLAVANLKRGDNKWQEWLDEQVEAKATDAVLAIILLISALVAAIEFNNALISVFAGIIVAGIASEEWISPQAIVFGAIARFLKNESLAVRMYFKTNSSIGVRSLFITLLGSAGEFASLFDSAFSTISLAGGNFTGTEGILIITTAINVFCLLPCALSWFYQGIRVQDLPKDKYLQPRIYIPKKYPFLAHYLDNCSWPPTKSTKNVARIRLHWSRGGFENNIEGFLSGSFLASLCASPKEPAAEEEKPTLQKAPSMEEEIRLSVNNDEDDDDASVEDFVNNVIVDLAAPGSPSSFACFGLCFPAVAKMYNSYLMKGTFFFDGSINVCTKVLTLLLVVVEVVLALIGAFVTIVCDIPAAILLGLAALLLRIFPYYVVRRLLYIAPFPLAGYNLADVVLIVFLNFYSVFAVRVLELNTMTCRSKSMSRWYRFPSTVKSRTGRASNHCWYGGSYFEDQYYVAGDVVMMNPRWPLMGLVDAGMNVNGAGKCVWTSRGRTYENPSLCY